MMNAKWITDIELVDSVYEGFWQRRGWANNAKYQTHSKIVFPGDALLNRFEELATNTTGETVGNKSPIAWLSLCWRQRNIKGRGQHRWRKQLADCKHQRSAFKQLLGSLGSRLDSTK